jgi:hypothetical protein
MRNKRAARGEIAKHFKYSDLYHVHVCDACGAGVTDSSNFSQHWSTAACKKRRAELASAADQTQARSQLAAAMCRVLVMTALTRVSQAVLHSSARSNCRGFMQDGPLASGSAPFTAQHTSPIVPIDADPRRDGAGADGTATEDQAGHRACASPAPQRASDETTMGTPVLAAPHDVGEPLRPGDIEATVTETAFRDAMSVDERHEPSPQLHPCALSPSPPASRNCFPGEAVRWG